MLNNNDVLRRERISEGIQLDGALILQRRQLGCCSNANERVVKLIRWAGMKHIRIQTIAIGCQVLPTEILFVVKLRLRLARDILIRDDVAISHQDAWSNDKTGGQSLWREQPAHTIG